TNGNTAIDLVALATGGETSWDVSAEMSCAPEVNRAAGSFASNRDTVLLSATGTTSRSSVTSRGVSIILLAMVACALPPLKGRTPVSTSYSTQPNEKKSVR